jgi:hypothetical protein
MNKNTPKQQRDYIILNPLKLQALPDMKLTDMKNLKHLFNTIHNGPIGQP